MNSTSPSRFLLFGVALAAGLVAVALWLGAMRPAYTHFTGNVHTTCGDPVTMRAEGYNLLGGTRYGTDAGDPGADVDLALIDICDPVIQVLPGGEERLWFWLSVEATGQTFSYYGWGSPERDITNPNANEWRDPVDPLWNHRAFLITNYAADEVYWTTTRGEICPPADRSLPGIALFVDSENDFRIPQGSTRQGWVCVRMGEGRPLPDTLMISFRPELTRLTRWVDRLFEVRGQHRDEQTGALRQGYLQAVLHTAEDLCYLAQDTHPQSILPGGGCPHSAD